MLLELEYPTVEEVPEEYRALYTEADGVFKLTEVNGMKTQSDFDKLNEGVVKERLAHKATKAKNQLLNKWDGMDFDEVQTQLDSIEELKLKAEGQVDEEKNEKIIQARLKKELAPFQRELEELKANNGTLSDENKGFKADKSKRRIHDEIDEANRQSKIGKILDSAMPDVRMNGEHMLMEDEEGKIVTKEGVTGVTAGVPVDIWLSEMADKRGHWYPPSQGGGANGGKGGAGISSNPWSKTHWNETKQNQYQKEHGTEKAEMAAKSAGSSLGAMDPPA